MDTRNIRTTVASLYDIQGSRIRYGNQLCADHRASIAALHVDDEPSEIPDEEETDAKSAKFLNLLVKDYKRISDEVAGKINSRTFKPGEIINSYEAYFMAETYVALLDREAAIDKLLAHMLGKIPIWTEFLESVKGIGPRLAGRLIHAVGDISMARHASSLWKLFGLDVYIDPKTGIGSARTLYKPEHQVDKTISRKDGTVKEFRGAAFDPKRRALAVGVIGASFIKAKNSKYSPIFYNYRTRMENHAIYGVHNDGKEVDGYGKISKMRRMRQATRYMVKIFLADLWLEWRKIEGLPISDPYSVAKLGMGVHGAA